MSPTSAMLLPSGTSPSFSGHETFALRANWLKKAYDLLLAQPDLFTREDSFVRLGVGKNMAQSIRHWGHVCRVFERLPGGRTHQATSLGHALLADNGWDPFLVTPTGRWLLHWQIAARPEAAFTWFFTFNLLRGGEFTLIALAEQIQSFVREHEYLMPSDATLSRDIECMIHCYVPPSRKQLVTIAEDSLSSPLMNLGLVKSLPSQGSYRLVSDPQPDLPDELVAFAVLAHLRSVSRRTAAFHDLAFAPGSPGRVFRLDEDSLLERLQCLDTITGGAITFSDSAGIRQVSWRHEDFDPLALLAHAFADEALYG